GAVVPGPADLRQPVVVDVGTEGAAQRHDQVLRGERLPARAERTREAVAAGVAAVLVVQRREAAREHLDELPVAKAPGPVVDLGPRLHDALARRAAATHRAEGGDDAAAVAHGDGG